jgi:electron transfer flavoprotein beta subunit
MKIVVPIQLVPDLVEELEISPDGTSFDYENLVWIINEFDDHAIEQAILIKEKTGAEVTILAPDMEDIDDPLFTAAAKGADKLLKIAADFDNGVNNHALSKLFAPTLRSLQPDLILTGVSNHDGLDGSLGPLMAHQLGLPYIGYVSSVAVAGDKATVHKDFPGGLKARLEVKLPAVLGIASSETPPRYVPVSKVRQSMKTSQIDELEGEMDLSGVAAIDKMYEPEAAEKAEMITGDIADISNRLVQILKEQGLI